MSKRKMTSVERRAAALASAVEERYGRPGVGRATEVETQAAADAWALESLAEVLRALHAGPGLV